MASRVLEGEQSSISSEELVLSQSGDACVCYKLSNS